jgi:hypothetical protein
VPVEERKARMHEMTKVEGQHIDGICYIGAKDYA